MNISCGSVDIWSTFTLSMSWWTTVSWQTTSDEIPPCHTGRQLLDSGIVASSSLGLTRKKRNYFSSLFLQLLGYTMCTPPGLALSCWLPWWLCFLGSTSYCLIAIVCRLPCLIFFFFLHCRTSARLGRSTTGVDLLPHRPRREPGKIQGN